MSAAVDPGSMRHGQLLCQSDMSLGQQTSPPMESTDGSDVDVNENATLRISTPLDFEVAEKLSIQLNNKQTSLTVDLEKQECDLDTLWKTIKQECKMNGISVDQEPIRSQLAKIHKLEMIRKEHAKTLEVLREEYQDRLRLITAKRNSCSPDAASRSPTMVTSPPVTPVSSVTPVTSPAALVTPQPPSRPVAVVPANVNPPKVRQRVGRQRSLQQNPRTPDKRRRTKSDVMAMRTSPPMRPDDVLPPQPTTPTVFNMMSQHMTVNMLAHPNHSFMSPPAPDMTEASKTMLFGSQPPPRHPHISSSAYSFPSQQNNNNNHAYNTMPTSSHMNGMTNFYTMQSHSSMSPNCSTRQANQFVGLNQTDKFYQIPPDPTDPSLGKRMLRNLLMGEKQGGEGGQGGGQCKPHGQVFHQGANAGVGMSHGDPLLVHQPSPSFRDISNPQRHLLKPHYHQHMSQHPPHHHLLLHQQQQQQQAVMSSSSQQQQHHQQQNLGLCNPPPFIEEPLNLDETLSKEIMQLDDQMLQASLDVAGILPDQWENIQLTDEDYL